jgi:hypothetical protein
MMNYRLVPITITLLLLLLSNAAGAAFDPGKLGKSTVRITIKEAGKIRSAASGFAWQKPTWIVTSLHVMHRGESAETIVEFNGHKRRATVLKVLPKADLVLLQINRPIKGLVPLVHYNVVKPPWDAPIIALGYNSGATGMMTRKLRKGYGAPEVLKGLLPAKDRDELAAIKIPDIELDIYYLDGSLLPGFSGSPVVDAKGVLIGIGNGGLENGASNVSWVIPVRFLDELTASGASSLPASLGKAQQSFSADLKDSSDYVEVVYDNFVFVKTKTRSFEELAASSADPAQLREMADSFMEDLGFMVEIGSLEFDIYEDVNHGIIITIPSGVNLILNEDEDGDSVLTADYADKHDDSYSINYYIIPSENAFDASQNVEVGLNELADLYLEYMNENHEVNLVEADDTRGIEYFEGQQYILRTVFHDFYADVESREFNYINIATNLEFVFLAQAELDRFDGYFLPMQTEYFGTDCRQPGLNGDQEIVCSEMRVMLQILTSVHLTTFANAQVLEASN